MSKFIRVDELVEYNKIVRFVNVNEILYITPIEQNICEIVFVKHYQNARNFIKVANNINNLLEQING